MRTTAIRSITATSIAALAFSSLGVTTASAEPQETSGAEAVAAAQEKDPNVVAPEDVDPDEFEQQMKDAAKELDESDLPRREEEHDGEQFIVYDVDGRDFPMPKKLTEQPSGIQPMIDGGPAIAGPWFEFTPTEQKMLVGGTSGFFTALLCAGSFGTACALAGTFAGAAMAWVGDNGLCPNEGRLLLEYNWAGGIRGFECR